MSSDLRILTVCTGNICRSPAVEYLLRDALGPSVEVTSAGTQALVGHPIDPQMAALLPMDGSDFAARRLSARAVRDADLAIGLSREHRSRMVALYPGALRYAFTLRELARILRSPQFLGQSAEGTPGRALAELIPSMAAARTRVRAVDSVDDDIVDPYRQSDDAFRAAFAQIGDAVDAVAAAVGANRD